MEMKELLSALDALALERQGDGRFVVRSGLPGWCLATRPRLRWDEPLVIEDVFPFLSVFMPSAMRAWSSNGPARADSDLWTETDDTGHEVHLTASAVNVGAARALIVLRSDLMFVENQALLQRARELRMTHASLMRELEHKDILVHAIVHDLAAPLHSIMGVLSMLDERPHADPEGSWIRVGIQAAERQRELISDILDTFVAERDTAAREGMNGVDLGKVIERVAVERSPVARTHDVRIDKGTLLERCDVIADETRLFRVLTNLLDNAIRHSPMGGVVRISMRPEDGMIAVWVEDHGPGVPADLIPRLFEKFARGADGRSGTGLGLFFCRITVENWGGGIGYERPDGRSSRFWIRLRRWRPGHGEGAADR